MRKSVEHLGPQHEAQNFLITEGLIMRICWEFEHRRFLFMEGILKQHGKAFPRTAFDYAYPTKDWTGRCYDQAMWLANLCCLTYCEGIMLARTPQGLLAMPHAWCCNERGEVLDPTAHKVQGNLNLTYIGIPIRKEYHEAWQAQYGFYGLLDGHPELGDTVGVYRDHPTQWKVRLEGVQHVG